MHKFFTQACLVIACIIFTVTPLWSQDFATHNPMDLESYMNPALVAVDGYDSFTSGVQHNYMDMPSLYNTFALADISLSKKKRFQENPKYRYGSFINGIGVYAMNNVFATNLLGNSIYDYSQLGVSISSGLYLSRRSQLNLGLTFQCINQKLNASQLTFGDQLDPYWGKISETSSFELDVNPKPIFNVGFGLNYNHHFGYAKSVDKTLDLNASVLFHGADSEDFIYTGVSGTGIKRFSFSAKYNFKMFSSIYGDLFYFQPYIHYEYNQNSELKQMGVLCYSDFGLKAGYSFAVDFIEFKRLRLNSHFFHLGYEWKCDWGKISTSYTFVAPGGQNNIALKSNCNELSLKLTAIIPRKGDCITCEDVHYIRRR